MRLWNKTSCYKQLRKELRYSFRYYYEKGDNQYKEDYKMVFYSLLEFKENANFKLRDLTYYEQLYRECVSDNPLLFYIENVTFSIGSFGVRMMFNYSYKWEQTEIIYKKIFSCVNRIRVQCSDDPEELKIGKIHDYIVENVEYDDSPDLPVHYSHSFFVYRKAVCDGISKAAKILMDGVSIKSIVIYGDATTPNSFDDNLGHAWNIVWINDRPSHYDFTFDNNLSLSKEIVRYDYYSLSDEQIRQDHKYSDLGIVFSESKNDWFVQNGLYFTKKVEIRKHVYSRLKNGEKYIAFKLPNTKNRRATLDSIIDIVKDEIRSYISGAVSYSSSINEAQMVVYIFL